MVGLVGFPEWVDPFRLLPYLHYLWNAQCLEDVAPVPLLHVVEGKLVSSRDDSRMSVGFLGVACVDGSKLCPGYFDATRHGYFTPTEAALIPSVRRSLAAAWSFSVLPSAAILRSFSMPSTVSLVRVVFLMSSGTSRPLEV